MRNCAGKRGFLFHFWFEELLSCECWDTVSHERVEFPGNTLRFFGTCRLARSWSRRRLCAPLRESKDTPDIGGCDGHEGCAKVCSEFRWGRFREVRRWRRPSSHSWFTHVHRQGKRETGFDEPATCPAAPTCRHNHSSSAQLQRESLSLSKSSQRSPSQTNEHSSPGCTLLSCSV
jgi:hypothetical protein